MAGVPPLVLPSVSEHGVPPGQRLRQAMAAALQIDDRPQKGPGAAEMQLEVKDGYAMHSICKLISPSPIPRLGSIPLLPRFNPSLPEFTILHTLALPSPSPNLT